MKKRAPLFWIIILLSAALGFWIGKLYPQVSPAYPKEDTPIRQSGYIYTNPLLECENNGSFAKQKYIPFERKLVEKIEDNITQNHSGVLLSVYFRNLNNGPWFGIRENNGYIPASLMKLTLLISYMKWWEEDPSLMGKKLIVKVNDEMNQVILPEKQLQEWVEYTISELLYYLIVYSDNNASKTLFENIPMERQNKTFIDLWVPVPQDKDYTVSVKEYASFFRILYNASYLSPNSSEAALSILASSKYTQWIRWWIDKNIVIAHKFGEREMIWENGIVFNQLHDCGIVYHPRYPYLICIMTRWTQTLESLSTVISGTSKIIFDEINLAYPYSK